MEKFNLASLRRRKFSFKTKNKFEKGSDIGKKQHSINLLNLCLVFISVTISALAFWYTKKQFEVGRQEVSEQIEIAKKEYTLANKQFQTQRIMDSIQSIENEKKFLETLKSSGEQINAIRAITDYSLAAQKPFFQSEFKVEFKDDKNKIPHMTLYTGLKNAGNRPSSNLSIYLILIDFGYNGIQYKFEFGSPNGVAPNENYYHGTNIDNINGNRFYLYALICYYDPILSKKIQQKFYYKWANNMQNILESASWEEREDIDRYLEKKNSVPNSRQ